MKSPSLRTIVLPLLLCALSPLPQRADASPLPPPTLSLAPPDSRLTPNRQGFTFRMNWPVTVANPYDPSQARLDLEVVTPSGRTVLQPAFYVQPVEYRRLDQGGPARDWFYPVGPAVWEARFTPQETGSHTARCIAYTRLGQATSAHLPFTGTRPPQGGFIGVSPANPRFFAFADGQPFFPIGQNLAFVGPGQYLDLARFEAVLSKMTRNGANYARVWTGCEDWALAIEGRKSAWGRSWDWHPPLEVLSGVEGYHGSRLVARLDSAGTASWRLAPPQPVALRPSTAYVLRGEFRAATGPVRSAPEVHLVLDFQGPLPGGRWPATSGTSWTTLAHRFETSSGQWWMPEATLRVEGEGAIQIRGLSLREALGGPELLPQADPDRPPRGDYNPVDCALLDQVMALAERYGVRLQLCLLTRDHYRAALAEPQSAAYQQAILDAQNLVRYAVARWGSSPSMFAWEYFNEMDPNAPTDAFHTALGEYLERIDPYHHPRTTSGWGPAPRHWTHPELDIADLHWYLRPAWGPLSLDAVGAVLDRTTLLRNAAPQRPTMLGEFGLADDRWGLSPAMKLDPTGIHFHNALWASAFSGLSGTASFWWWETLDALDYYAHYRPLAEFLQDIPWTTGHLEPRLQTSQAGSRVLLWQGPAAVYGWVANPAAAWGRIVQEKQQVPPIEADQIVLAPPPAGASKLVWYDTWSGATIARQSVDTGGSDCLTVEIPPYTSDVAFQLTSP